MKLTLKIKGQDVTVEMDEAKRIWEELSGVFSSPQYVPMPGDTHAPPWNPWDVYGPIPRRDDPWITTLPIDYWKITCAQR